MPKIRCKYLDCAFLDENYCISAEIELDSNGGCLTYKPLEDTPIEETLDEMDIDDYDVDDDVSTDDEDSWMDDEDEDQDDYN